MGACARRFAAASIDTKAHTSIAADRVDHAPWRRPSPAAPLSHIKPLTARSHLLELALELGGTGGDPRPERRRLEQHGIPAEGQDLADQPVVAPRRCLPESGAVG